MKNIRKLYECIFCLSCRVVHRVKSGSVLIYYNVYHYTDLCSLKKSFHLGFLVYDASFDNRLLVPPLPCLEGSFFFSFNITAKFKPCFTEVCLRLSGCAHRRFTYCLWPMWGVSFDLSLLVCSLLSNVNPCSDESLRDWKLSTTK